MIACAPHESSAPDHVQNTTAGEALIPVVLLFKLLPSSSLEACMKYKASLAILLHLDDDAVQIPQITIKIRITTPVWGVINSSHSSCHPTAWVE